MKGSSKEYWSIVRGSFVVAAILVFICFICSSCEVFKKSQRVTTDTTQVRKIDSGAIHKNELTTKTDTEWWREVLNFIPRDSTYIEKTNQPIYYTQPVQIIREGGSIQYVQQQVDYDSIWNNKMDSLLAKFQTTKTESKAQAFNFWQIIALAALGLIILNIIGSKLRISLKK